MVRTIAAAVRLLRAPRALVSQGYLRKLHTGVALWDDDSKVKSLKKLVSRLDSKERAELLATLLAKQSVRWTSNSFCILFRSGQRRAPLCIQ
jgi:hypothetical protein